MEKLAAPKGGRAMNRENPARNIYAKRKSQGNEDPQRESMSKRLCRKRYKSAIGAGLSLSLPRLCCSVLRLCSFRCLESRVSERGRARGVRVQDAVVAWMKLCVALQAHAIAELVTEEQKATFALALPLHGITACRKPRVHCPRD